MQQTFKIVKFYLKKNSAGGLSPKISPGHGLVWLRYEFRTKKHVPTFIIPDCNSIKCENSKTS